MKSVLKKYAHMVACKKTSCTIVEELIHDADGVSRLRTIHR